MTVHSVADAKNQLPSLIDRALQGETVIISRHGTPVAEITAIGREGRPMTAEDVAWLRRGRVGRRAADGPDAGQFVSDMRDEDDARLS